MEDLYTLLNIKRTANAKEIRAAYRALSKQHHPDKGNGNSEMFHKITVAYDTLMNKTFRKHYDSTGQIIDKLPEDEITICARRDLAGIFQQTAFNIIQHHDPDKVSIINVVRNNLENGVEAENKNLAIMKFQVKKLEVIKNRLKSKKEFLIEVLSVQIQSIIEQQELCSNRIKVLERMLVILKDYSYDLK
jgi:curved DNA-binding protein CbpA